MRTESALREAVRLWILQSALSISHEDLSQTLPLDEKKVFLEILEKEIRLLKDQWEV